MTKTHRKECLVLKLIMIIIIFVFNWTDRPQPLHYHPVVILGPPADLSANKSDQMGSPDKHTERQTPPGRSYMTFMMEAGSQLHLLLSAFESKERNSEKRLICGDCLARSVSCNSSLSHPRSRSLRRPNDWATRLRSK